MDPMAKCANGLTHFSVFGLLLYARYAQNIHLISVYTSSSLSSHSPITICHNSFNTFVVF